MKNRLIKVLVLVVGCLSGLAPSASRVLAQSNHPYRFSPSSTPVTLQFLGSTLWLGWETTLLEPKPHGVSIEFRSNGTYYRAERAEGPVGRACAGTFKAFGSYAELSADPTNADECLAARCVLETVHGSAYHSLRMRCGSESLWPQKLYAQAGQNVAVQSSIATKSADAVTMGGKSGRTIWNMKLRVLPSTTAAEIVFARIGKDSVGPGPASWHALPKGTPLLVVARSKVRQKVNNWTNYWYFVHVSAAVGVDGDNEVSGWIFGEGISILP